MHIIASAVALFATGFLAAAPASAETIDYRADLPAASETPPKASNGTGSLKATYDTVSKSFSWTVTYSGLTGPATLAHFHGPAAIGKAAMVMIPVAGSLNSPIKGSATLTADQSKALMDGMMYFNIHTPDYKGGEIRGQVEQAM